MLIHLANSEYNFHGLSLSMEYLKMKNYFMLLLLSSENKGDEYLNKYSCFNMHGFGEGLGTKSILSLLGGTRETS